MSVPRTDMTDRIDAEPARRIPGVDGIWVFIGGDLLLFTLLFGSFMAERMQEPLLFEHARQLLNYHFGGVNTLILLASSWFVVLALQAARLGRSRRTGKWLVAAIACGLAFGISKAIEYSGKMAAGHTMLSNDFFMFYYILTGLHLVHVLAGCAALTVFAVKAGRGAYAAGSPTTGLECMALYWHMVDLLWIMLFPLLYLLR